MNEPMWAEVVEEGKYFPAEHELPPIQKRKIEAPCSRGIYFVVAFNGYANRRRPSWYSRMKNRILVFVSLLQITSFPSRLNS